MDIVCLIEASAHTAKHSELIKSSIEFIMSRLSGQDRLSLVCFNDISTRLCPLISMTYTGKVKVGMIIRNLVYGGSCDLVEGAIFAFSVLTNRRNLNSNANIVIITTGIDNHPDSVKERIYEVLREFLFRITSNFSMHIIAIGKPNNILNYIAEESNGHCYFSKDDQMFLQNLAYGCGIMESRIADDVNARIIVSDCLIPLIISKVYSENSETYFRMPDLLAGTQTDAIFILKFMPFAGYEFKSLEVLNVIVEYKIKGLKFTENLSLKIPIYSPEKLCKEIEIDEEILVSFYRVKAADIMIEASELMNIDIARARILLEQGAKELEEGCVSRNELIITLLLELASMKEMLNVSDESNAYIRNRARNHWSKRCIDIISYQNNTTKSNKSRLKAYFKLA